MTYLLDSVSSNDWVKNGVDRFTEVLDKHNVAVRDGLLDFFEIIFLSETNDYELIAVLRLDPLDAL